MRTFHVYVQEYTIEVISYIVGFTHVAIAAVHQNINYYDLVYVCEINCLGSIVHQHVN